MRLELRCVRLDRHAILEHRRARRDEVVSIGEADQAGSALAGWLQTIVVAERGDLDPEMSEDPQNGRARLACVRPAVDADIHIYTTGKGSVPRYQGGSVMKRNS